MNTRSNTRSNGTATIDNKLSLEENMPSTIDIRGANCFTFVLECGCGAPVLLRFPTEMLAGKLLTQQVTVVAIFVLVLLGIPGNTLMFLTVSTSRRLRHKAYSHYLACLALFDNIVLLMHAVDETGRLLGYRSLQQHLDASNLSALIGELSNPTAVGEAIYVDAGSSQAVTVPTTWDAAASDTEPNEAFQTLNFLSRFSPLQCKLWRYLEVVASTLCPWFIACLSVERMVMIYMPFRRRTLCSQSTAMLVIGALVGVILVLTFPTAYFVTQQTSERSDYCQEELDYSVEEQSPHLQMISFWKSRKWKLVVCVILLQFILPILVILVCNSLVLFRTYRMSTRSINLQGGAAHIRSMPTPPAAERILPRARFMRAGGAYTTAHCETPTQEVRTPPPSDSRPTAVGALARKSLKHLRSASLEIQSDSIERSLRHTQTTEGELVARRSFRPPPEEHNKRVSLSQIYWNTYRSVTYDASQRKLTPPPDTIPKPNPSDSGVAPSDMPDVAATTPNEMPTESHSLRASCDWGLRRTVLEASNSLSSLTRTETTSYGSHSRRESPLTHFPIAEEEGSSATASPVPPPPSTVECPHAADVDADGVVQVEMLRVPEDAGANRQQQPLSSGVTLLAYVSRSLAGLQMGKRLERVRTFFRLRRPRAATITSPLALHEQNNGDEAAPRREDELHDVWIKRDVGARRKKRRTLGNILDTLPSSPESNDQTEDAPPHPAPPPFASPPPFAVADVRLEQLSNNREQREAAHKRSSSILPKRNPPANLAILPLYSCTTGRSVIKTEAPHSTTPNGNCGARRSQHLHMMAVAGSNGSTPASSTQPQAVLQAQTSNNENVVRRARRRVTQILLCITFSFVLLNSPQLGFYLSAELRGDVVEDSFLENGTWFRWVELVASLGTLATAAINFFIYVIWGRNYREEMWSLLRSVSLARTGRNLILAIHSTIRSMHVLTPPPADAAANEQRDRDTKHNRPERSGHHLGTTLNGFETCALQELAH